MKDNQRIAKAYRADLTVPAEFRALRPPTQRALVALGIRTIQDLAKHGELCFLMQPLIGGKQDRALLRLLAKHGLTFLHACECFEKRWEKRGGSAAA
jgi:hypothetical protein